MNSYISIEPVKRKLGLTGTSSDVDVLSAVKAASRDIDLASARDGKSEGFFTQSGTRIYDVADTIYLGRVQRLPINECLAVTLIEDDTVGDGTFATDWDAADWVLGPPNTYPKTYVEAAPGGAKCFSAGSRKIRVTGTWGYGDGLSASPWQLLTPVATVANDTSQTITVDVATGIEVGMTLKIESEQVFVSAISSLNLTVERGVNGTTAAAHAGAAVYKAKYPDDIAQAALWFSLDTWRQLGTAGLLMERIGDYSYQTNSVEVTADQKQRMVNRHMRRGTVPRYD